MNKSAVFSPDHKYRYLLDRSWNDGDKGILMFCMLNPSTANEKDDDPTVRRCIGFARDWGYTGIRIVNLLAFVSSNPKELLGQIIVFQLKQNDSYILNAAMLASKIVVAWGEFGTHLPNRIEHVLEILNWKPVYCFGKNKSGQPRHPLYVKKMPEYALQVYQPSVAKLTTVGTK